MAIYYFFYFIILLGIFSKKRVNRIYSCFLIFISSVFIGIRYDVGADYGTYFNWYIDTPKLDTYFNNFSVLKEFGFTFLMSLFKSMGLSFQSFSFFFSLITSLLLLWVFKKFEVKNWVLLFLLYYGTLLLAHQCNTIRHGFIVPLLWLSFYSTYKGNFRHFIKYILIAVLFHYISLVFIPFYWIFRKRNYRLQILLPIFISSFLFYFGFINIIGLLESIPLGGVIFNRLNYYTETFYVVSDLTSNYRLSIGMLFNIMLLWFAYKFIKTTPTYYGYIWYIFYWSVILSIVFCDFAILFRISNVLSLAGLLLLYYIYDFSLLRPRYLILAFIVFYSFFGLYTNLKSGDGFDYIPYKFLF